MSKGVIAKALRVPTIIDIKPVVAGSSSNEDSPNFERIEVCFTIWSSNKFDYMVFHHLGFRARSKQRFRFDQGRYIAGDDLEPDVSALIGVKPFHLCLANIGDSYMCVSVRMRDGITQCKMTVLQEKYQPKAPKEVDTFIEYEGVYYCTTVINCLQTIRIEEL